MGFSTYGADTIGGNLYNAKGTALPATWYVGLFTVQPSGGSGGTEANYTGYARQSLTSGTTDFTVTSAGLTQNAIVVTFPTNTGSAQTVVGYGLFDALTGGNLWQDVAFASSQTINNGADASFAINALQFQIVVNP